MRISNLWYRVIRKLYDSYEGRLNKNIPQDIVTMFSKYDIDLYEVRFNSKVLSVDQVDKVLLYAKVATTTRMVVKNILYQYKCMEEGYIHREDSNITGVQYQPDRVNPNIWKHGPVIKEEEKKSWAYPYISDEDPPEVDRELLLNGGEHINTVRQRRNERDSHTTFVDDKKVQLDN